MTRVLMALVVAAVASVGCSREGNQEGGDTARFSADTTVTERTVQDTTIVTHDTIVRSDTIVRPGGATDTSAAARARRP